MSVDVEDYFQVTAFEDRIARKDWDRFESRVAANTIRLLDLFDRHQIRGTFFVLGWVADRHPGLVKRITLAGHQIASHGYWHRLVYELDPSQFEKDLSDATDAIHNACGFTPTAYRAPSFSITDQSLWALDVLAAQGFRTDSSIFPIRGHDRYGMPGSKKEIHTLQTKHGNLQEFPLGFGKVGGVSVPIGGGYFRLFPRSMTSVAIRQLERQGRPAMFYIHPWELDPDQPRIAGVSRRSRLRHYVNLASTESKLRKLITSHRFGTMSESMQSFANCTSLSRSKLALRDNTLSDDEVA
jgi:polysaccharide deacetylase family protein (PEP-CTERM system associated)